MEKKRRAEIRPKTNSGRKKEEEKAKLSVGASHEVEERIIVGVGGKRKKTQHGNAANQTRKRGAKEEVASN